MYRDPDLDPNAEESERDEELARRIRKEVMRIQSGETDERMRSEGEAQGEICAERTEAERRRQKREGSLLWGLVTGSVIGREWLARHYRYPLLIAGIFLLSIFIMFWSLRLDMRHIRLEGDVQLLRERAVRLSEQRSRITTHSAVAAELRRRGIPLTDPLAPGEKIDR